MAKAKAVPKAEHRAPRTAAPLTQKERDRIDRMKASPETAWISVHGESMPYLLTDDAAVILDDVYGADPVQALSRIIVRVVQALGITGGEGSPLVRNKDGEVDAGAFIRYAIDRLPTLLDREVRQDYRILLLWGLYYFDRDLEPGDIVLTPGLIATTAREVYEHATSWTGMADPAAGEGSGGEEPEEEEPEKNS